MAKSKHQRIGIWIITIVMTVGTLGSFVVMILANDNQAIDAAAEQQAYADYEKQQTQAAEANAASAQPLDGYTATPFDAASVTELKKEVLVQGEGAVVKESDTIKAGYFGWLSSGKIFDSSKKSGTNTPISLPLTGVIAGWTEGLTGEKVGSTIKLTIPSAKAYRDQASGIIPANSPLQFIITIDSVEAAS